MENIEKVFSVRNKSSRYNKLVDWITSEIFENKISILERSKFSEKRVVRKNGKKLLAKVIFSKDPESSAWRGPAIVFKIFEKQRNDTWLVDMRIIKPVSGLGYSITDYKDLDFRTWINQGRSNIMKEFIRKN